MIIVEVNPFGYFSSTKWAGIVSKRRDMELLQGTVQLLADSYSYRECNKGGLTVGTGRVHNSSLKLANISGGEGEREGR